MPGRCLADGCRWLARTSTWWPLEQNRRPFSRYHFLTPHSGHLSPRGNLRSSRRSSIVSHERVITWHEWRSRLLALWRICWTDKIRVMCLVVGKKTAVQDTSNTSDRFCLRWANALKPRPPRQHPSLILMLTMPIFTVPFPFDLKIPQVAYLI